MLDERVTGNFKMLQRVCILIVLFIVIVQAAEFSIKAKIQPRVQIEESGSFADSGRYLYDFHRIKLYTTYRKKLSDRVRVSSALSFDFTEKNVNNLVKEALVSLTMQEYILLRTGQLKLPFYYNDYCGSGEIGHNYRNNTVKHLRKELAIGGYQKGVVLSGLFWKDKIEIGAGLFYAKNIDIEGVSGSELLMLPNLNILFRPIEPLMIRYAFVAPHFEALYIDGQRREKRVPLHSFSLGYKTGSLYKTSLELFWGADTALGKELMQLQETYDENLSFSLYSNHVFAFSLSEKMSLETALAGEFLNGLTFYDSLYRDRQFNYALWGTFALRYGKKLSIAITFNESFDKQFNAKNEKQISVEGTYSPTLIKWRGK